MAPTSRHQPARREPLYDIDPVTGVSVEVFYADRTVETFGRGGAGWFWWSRRPGCAPAVNARRRAPRGRDRPQQARPTRPAAAP
jgi:hypothetical protein